MQNGYYNGITFHRVINDFDSGDPTATGMGGESIYGGAFEDEFSLNAFNLYGALSMATQDLIQMVHNFHCSNERSTSKYVKSTCRWWLATTNR